MLKHLKLIFMLVISYLVFMRRPNQDLPSTIDLLTANKPLKDNANVPSDITWDMVATANEQETTSLPSGTIIPLPCLMSYKETELQKRHSYIEQCNTALTNVGFFVDRGDKLNSARELELGNAFQKLLVMVDLKKNQMATQITFNSEQSKLLFRKEFHQLLKYRKKIEIALFAQKQSHINCDEQTALAYLDLLFRLNEAGWPKHQYNALHSIAVSAPKAETNHVFLLLGDSSLREDLKIHGNEVVAQKLKGLNGYIIDNWNNPRSGGLRMPAHEARKLHKLYGGGESKVWETLETTRLPLVDIHKRLNQLPLPPLAIEFLKFCAGPTLDEMKAGLPSLSERIKHSVSPHEPRDSLTIKR